MHSQLSKATLIESVYRANPTKKLKSCWLSNSAYETGTAKSSAIGAGPSAGMVIRRPNPGATRKPLSYVLSNRTKIRKTTPRRESSAVQPYIQVFNHSNGPPTIASWPVVVSCRGLAPRKTNLAACCIHQIKVVIRRRIRARESEYGAHRQDMPA